jgi:hypothetical protein
LADRAGIETASEYLKELADQKMIMTHELLDPGSGKTPGRI